MYLSDFESVTYRVYKPVVIFSYQQHSLAQLIDSHKNMY